MQILIRSPRPAIAALHATPTRKSGRGESLDADSGHARMPIASPTSVKNMAASERPGAENALIKKPAQRPTMPPNLAPNLTPHATVSARHRSGANPKGLKLKKKQVCIIAVKNAAPQAMEKMRTESALFIFLICLLPSCGILFI